MHTLLSPNGSRFFFGAMLMMVAVASSGCRDHAAAISGEQAAPSASAPALDAAPSDLDAAVDASDADIGVPFDAGPLKAAVKVASADKWLTDRGASVPAFSSSYSVTDCEEIAVGTAREAALVCTDVKGVSRTTSTPEGDLDRVIDHRTVRVVRAGSAVTVLDAEIKLEPLDTEGDGRQHDLLDLRFRLAPDGMSATIDDHGPGVDCPSAKYLNDKSSCTTGDVWSRFDCDLTVRMCNARGGYVWQGDRFVRDPNWKDPTPAATHAKSAPTSTTQTRGGWDPRREETAH